MLGKSLTFARNLEFPVCPWPMCFKDYFIEYKQPEYLPSGKDCGCYCSKMECKFDHGDPMKLPK